MLKFLKYCLKSILIGISIVIALNFIGQWFNFHLPFNAVSVFLIGFFHIPGLLLLLIILIL